MILLSATSMDLERDFLVRLKISLHEVLNDMNRTRDQKKHALLLFIDFRKAFDTVNPDILLMKLRNYHFDKNALYLLESYFSSRSQLIKLDFTLSSP